MCTSSGTGRAQCIVRDLDHILLENDRALTQGLIIPGAFAIEIVESVPITTSTFPLRSQEEIGQGGGLSCSTRNVSEVLKS